MPVIPLPLGDRKVKKYCLRQDLVHHWTNAAIPGAEIRSTAIPSSAIPMSAIHSSAISGSANPRCVIPSHAIS